MELFGRVGSVGQLNAVVLGRVNLLLYQGGTRWRSWLRHYATSQKVAGSIPDGVIGIFH